MGALIKFARALGLDETEWLEMAGYEPIQAATLDGSPLPPAYRERMEKVLSERGVKRGSLVSLENASTADEFEKQFRMLLDEAMEKER